MTTSKEDVVSYMQKMQKSDEPSTSVAKKSRKKMSSGMGSGMQAAAKRRLMGKGM